MDLKSGEFIQEHDQDFDSPASSNISWPAFHLSNMQRVDKLERRMRATTHAEMIQERRKDPGGKDKWRGGPGSYLPRKENRKFVFFEGFGQFLHARRHLEAELKQSQNDLVLAGLCQCGGQHGAYKCYLCVCVFFGVSFYHCL